MKVALILPVLFHFVWLLEAFCPWLDFSPLLKLFLRRDAKYLFYLCIIRALQCLVEQFVWQWQHQPNWIEIFAWIKNIKIYTPKISYMAIYSSISLHYSKKNNSPVIRGKNGLFQQHILDLHFSFGVMYMCQVG